MSAAERTVQFAVTTVPTTGATSNSTPTTAETAAVPSSSTTGPNQSESAVAQAWAVFRKDRKITGTQVAAASAINSISSSLAQKLETLWPKEVIEARFQIPEQYLEWAAFPGAGHCGGEWSWLDSPFTLGVNDAWLCGDTPNPEIHDIWVVIGGWSDKHYYHLNCDRQSAQFGVVGDWNDCHPYSNSDPDSTYRDFAHFLLRKK